MMNNENEIGVTLSASTEAMFLAAQARIAAIPARTSLISEISDDEWLDANVVDWMINAGTKAGEDADELDASDEATVQVA
jgi:hypothetical protein